MDICKIETTAPDYYTLSGALNFNTVTQAWENYQRSFNQLSGTVLQINLKEVTQCDSAGAALLVACLKYARQHNKKLVFIELPEQMQAILQVSGLKKLITST